MPARQPNLILIGIDSLRADHMSLYGYPRLTTPHIDRWARSGTVFERAFSPNIPTTSGYTSMFTGRDLFSTGIVALRHPGDMEPGVRTLAEILGEHGYATTCVGFRNIAARGFRNYIDYPAWGEQAAGRMPKADNLNAVALPELKRLAGEAQPFFLFLRHMDPHTPYLPPAPFERVFYAGDEFDPDNTSMDPVFSFKPFCDYFASWLPKGVRDKDYVIALYDGAVAYMDAAIANIFAAIETLGLAKNTLVVLDSDHGETLYDHDCYFDHHGLYEPTLKIPLVFNWPRRVPAELRVPAPTTLLDITPTILDLLGVKPGIRFEGRSLLPWLRGRRQRPWTEFYLTECTWMRKHGWRTPHWKLIHALEPDFHFKPEIELYDLVDDPEETVNLAKKEPGIVKMLEDRMQAWIARREKDSGHPNPIETNPVWHGLNNRPGPFTSAQEAYDTLHIGSVATARQLQARKD